MRGNGQTFGSQELCYLRMMRTHKVGGSVSCIWTGLELKGEFGNLVILNHLRSYASVFMFSSTEYQAWDYDDTVRGPEKQVLEATIIPWAMVSQMLDLECCDFQSFRTWSKLTLPALRMRTNEVHWTLKQIVPEHAFCKPLQLFNELSQESPFGIIYWVQRI